MAKIHPFTLLALLLFIVAIGLYFGVYKTESFAASDGGALIQLATSHVPTERELRRF
jgi:hypothetical protein